MPQRPEVLTFLYLSEFLFRWPFIRHADITAIPVLYTIITHRDIIIAAQFAPYTSNREDIIASRGIVIITAAGVTATNIC